jgi:hypothetical protein
VCVQLCVGRRCRASRNFLHHSLKHLSLIKFGPYTALILRWISAALWTSAWKKWITVRISHLLGVTITAHMLTCS